MPRRPLLARVRLPDGTVVDVYDRGTLEWLLSRAGRAGEAEHASQAQPAGQSEAQPTPGERPAQPRSGAARRGERGARGRSPLDEVEDLVIIRHVRKPEALAQAAKERGLLLHDFSEDGYPGVVAVFKPSFADFAKTVAETDRPAPRLVEDRAHEILSGKRQLSSPDDKVLVALFALNREGEILWDGSRWVEPGRARPAPPLQEQLKQLREQQRAEIPAGSPEKTAQQPQQAQAAQQLDERVKKWLELFEKEFPRLKTAMLVWSVKDAEALRRLAERHGLTYYDITAEKAVVLRRDYVRDACAYANERGWTREKVADIVADTLRAKPHALSNDEIAALALEAALSLGLAEHKGGSWHAK